MQLMLSPVCTFIDSIDTTKLSQSVDACPIRAITLSHNLFPSGGHLHLRRRRVQQELRLRVRPLLGPEHHPRPQHQHHDNDT